MEPREVTGAERLAAGVLARSLAEHEAYWNALGTLSRAQLRWRDFERKLRINLAARGLPPPESGDPIIEEIRSGQWERRQRRNMEALLRDRAKLAKGRREGRLPERKQRTAGVTIELRGKGVPPEVVVALRQRAAFERALKANLDAPVVHFLDRQEPAVRPRERRPREHRSRSRTRRASRDSPGLSEADDEPHPVALLRGFTAASERLLSHLDRRAARRIA
jgi:hypothetical protein